jgi:hypothetical protein
MREVVRTRRALNGDKPKLNGKGEWPMPETATVSTFEDSPPVYGEIVVPRQADFDADFMHAPALAACAAWLIESYSELSHISGADVKYLWKKVGGASKGHLTLGKCVKASGLVSYFSDAAFIIWAGADNCREEELSTRQIEALVYHELKHITQDPETKALVLVGHDWEGFVSEVERYGQWRPGRAAAQLRLAFAELA